MCSTTIWMNAMIKILLHSHAFSHSTNLIAYALQCILVCETMTRQGKGENDLTMFDLENL